MAGLSTGTTATTAQSKELCIGCIAFDVGTFTENPTNSFTEVTERASGAPDLTVLERIVSATGAYETTVSFGDGGNFVPTPPNYALCGVIATFKGGDESASISINVSNASCITPNANVQAAAQTSASLSTATASSPAATFGAGVSQSVSVSSATATLLTIAENHGSSVIIEDEPYFFPVLPFLDSNFGYSEATMLDVTPVVSLESPVFTATSDMPVLTAIGDANTSLSVMTATTRHKDASAQGDKGVVAARRIIISCG